MSAKTELQRILKAMQISEEFIPVPKSQQKEMKWRYNFGKAKLDYNCHKTKMTAKTHILNDNFKYQCPVLSSQKSQVSWMAQEK